MNCYFWHHPIHYYFPEDRHRMAHAHTFEELCVIAFEVLQRIGPHVSMVCGPITNGGFGNIRENLIRFKIAITRLAYVEPKIFYQLLFEESISRICCSEQYYTGEDQLLNAFYLPLFCSGIIKQFYFIPHWETSDGTRWELNQARTLGIRQKFLHPKFETFPLGKPMVIADHVANPERFLCVA